MNKIDIVILWINPEDKYWNNEYEKYSEIEGRKVEGSIRYRDYGTLKYILRGIEKNAPWVNKVHLILSGESQIPTWLDVNYDSLEIHYHKEFIPVNLLPTFNSNVIEVYLHKIKSLSQHYILFNDDQFILNKLDAEMFVKDNYPVFMGKTKPLEFKLDLFNSFHQSLDNNLKFEINFCTQNNLSIKKYKHAHLPECHCKDFEMEVVSNNKPLFINSFIRSKFRSNDNFTNWLFSDLIQLKGDYYKNIDLYNNSCYHLITNQTNFNDFKDKQLVCFNDNKDINFMECTKRLVTFLDSIYPDKSSFEN